MSSLEERITELEAAVLNLALLEFGDTEGHPFRGNQYRGGGGPASSKTGTDSVGARAMGHTSAAEVSRRAEVKSRLTGRDARGMTYAEKITAYREMHGKDPSAKGAQQLRDSVAKEYGFSAAKRTQSGDMRHVRSVNDQQTGGLRVAKVTPDAFGEGFVLSKEGRTTSQSTHASLEKALEAGNRWLGV